MTLTTPERVLAYQTRTGLTGRQVMLVLARCALVRYLSDNYWDRFILKGGSLLYHVYRTQRVSFVDTDFADVQTHIADLSELEGVLTIDSDDGEFTLTTLPDGRWQEKGSIVHGSRLQFSIAGLELGAAARGRVSVSVSFRPSERIDTPKDYLMFDSEGLLENRSIFAVNGLTLNEMAAEKVIAWCVKDEFYKHLADLALIARDHQHELDAHRVAQLIALKFAAERDAMESRLRYRSLELTEPKDLNKYFLEAGRLTAMHENWASQLGSTIVLRREEATHRMTIRESQNVEQLIRDYWEPIIADL
jgi:hypothetical protein